MCKYFEVKRFHRPTMRKENKTTKNKIIIYENISLNYNNHTSLSNQVNGSLLREA